jgi:hypothetical protein
MAIFMIGEFERRFSRTVLLQARVSADYTDYANFTVVDPTLKKSVKSA